MRDILIHTTIPVSTHGLCTKNENLQSNTLNLLDILGESLVKHTPKKRYIIWLVNESFILYCRLYI